MSAMPSAAGNPCFAHGCSICCHDTAMPLREEDARRLEAAGHDRARFSRIEDGMLLLRNEKGACVFLKQGTCSVYDARPEGCRLYPLVMYEGEGPGMDELCPWRDEFSRSPEEARRLDALVARITQERAMRLAGRGGQAGFK